MPEPRNLFAALTVAVGDEWCETLSSTPHCRIERIVSTGQASPEGFWYDQPGGEWVVVLQGEALLRFEDEAAPLRLWPGDWVDIAPRRRHRVEWTHPELTTVWLAVHYAADAGQAT